jgi:hypothetical protein
MRLYVEEAVVGVGIVRGHHMDVARGLESVVGSRRMAQAMQLENTTHIVREERERPLLNTTGIAWEEREKALASMVDTGPKALETARGSGRIEWEELETARGSGVRIEWEELETARGSGVCIEWEESERRHAHTTGVVLEEPETWREQSDGVRMEVRVKQLVAGTLQLGAIVVTARDYRENLASLMSMVYASKCFRYWETGPPSVAPLWRPLPGSGSRPRHRQ